MTSSPPTDDALERLLSDFFSREMPPELRSLPDRPDPLTHDVHPSAEKRTTTRSGWKTGLATLALVACGVLVAVVSVPRNHAGPPHPADVSRETPSLPNDSAVATTRAASPSSDAAEPSTDSASAGAAGQEPLIIVDGFARDGRRRANDRRIPVEQRSDRNWANAPLIEVPAGAKTDYSVPNEITIEILPLEGRPVTPRTPPQAPDDTRLPEQRGEGP